MTREMNVGSPGSRGGSGQEFSTRMLTRDLALTLDRVRPFTQLAAESLADLAYQVIEVLTYDIPGSFVECGVWRGGASFLMADVLRQAGVRNRKVWLLDSFEEMPPPQEIDGPAAAIEWAKNTDDPLYRSIEEVQHNAKKLGLASYTEFVKGWFEETLPLNRDRLGPIAILRIDCDWYSSVRCCLDNPYDLVVDGGFIILDDYYMFDGCAIAAHEFLGERRLSHRIQTVPSDSEGYERYQAAFFRKGNTTWDRKWIARLELAREEMQKLILPGEAFVLIDENAWISNEVLPGRRRIPFLERDGEYWGLPADDETAIRELERLRDSGVSVLVFAWPAFWWLEHYTGFQRHMCSNFPCVLKNNRLVVFDLRPELRGLDPRTRRDAGNDANTQGSQLWPQQT